MRVDADKVKVIKLPFPPFLVPTPLPFRCSAVGGDGGACSEGIAIPEAIPFLNARLRPRNRVRLRNRVKEHVRRGRRARRERERNPSQSVLCVSTLYASTRRFIVTNYH